MHENCEIHWNAWAYQILCCIFIYFLISVLSSGYYVVTWKFQLHFENDILIK